MTDGAGGRSRRPSPVAPDGPAHADLGATTPEIEGAEIQYVERRPDGRIVLVFGYRGTDDGNGYLVVDEADIHFNPGETYGSDN